MEQIITRKPSNFAVFIQAIRPFSFTATLIPVLLVGAFAFRYY
ncbi:MAG: hypothetical protein HW421_4141, partial [Ignavibacteria bacterium]|nr:hypothetical protein [Ignavibacteria bacterium]